MSYNRPCANTTQDAGQGLIMQAQVPSVGQAHCKNIKEHEALPRAGATAHSGPKHCEAGTRGRNGYACVLRFVAIPAKPLHLG